MNHHYVSILIPNYIELKLRFYAIIPWSGCVFYATISRSGSAFYTTIPRYGCARLMLEITANLKLSLFLGRLLEFSI